MTASSGVAAAERPTGRRSVERHRRRVLHEAARRRRRRRGEDRGAERRPAAPLVGVGRDRSPTATTARCSRTSPRPSAASSSNRQPTDLDDAARRGCGSADVVVWSRGSAVAEAAGCRRPSSLAAHPHLVDRVDHPVRARRSVERPTGDRVHVAGVVGGDHRARPRVARPRADPRRRPDRRVADRGVRSCRHARRRCAGPPRHGHGEIVDVSMLEVLATCLTYYPVTFQRPARLPDATQALVPTPGVAAASRRSRRARVRHRPAVARLLRHGRPPRVDGGPVATSSTAPRSHRRSTPGSPSTRSPR